MKTQNALSASIAILAIMGLSACRTQSPPQVKPARFTPPVAESVSIAGYKQWTKVTSEPYNTDPRTWAMCFRPSFSPKINILDPHMSKYISVFVNPVGETAMLHDKNPNFPIGSVIVKEKLTSNESVSPVLLTVMRKRESGYNPTAGDWEYSVFNGEGTQIQAQGKLENCQKCHVKWKKTDYISRDYLPAQMGRRLK